MGNVPKYNIYSWIYICRIMFCRYVNHLWSSYRHWAWNWHQSDPWKVNLLSRIIWVWSCYPSLQYWFINTFIYWLHYLTCWKLCVDWNRHHAISSSMCLQCLPYNLAALLYTLPTVYSTPTTSQSDFVFVAFFVYDRSVISVSMGSSWALSPRCCALVHQLLVDHKLTNLLMAI